MQASTLSRFVVKLRTAISATLLLTAAACQDRSAPTAPQVNAPLRDDVSEIEFGATDPNLYGTTSVNPGAAPNLCLDVSDGMNADGTPVTTAACNGASSQQFTFDSAGTIRVFGDKCLDADYGRGRDGDRVNIWTCNGNPQQHWTPTAGSTIVGVKGKCLDLDYGRTTPGARIQIWSCLGNVNQKWSTAGLKSSPPPPPAAPPGGIGSAELPRVYLNTAMPVVSGRTLNVPSGGDLQGALDAAQPGDQIVLAAGATFVGNFVLPAKAGATSGRWIILRGSGSLPSEGTRVGPGDAAQMPKILTSNNFGPAIATLPGTQGWRITGVEVGAAQGTTWNYSLINFGSGNGDQSGSAQIPSRLILDRSYVHGSGSFDLRRCVALNSAYSAVIDSYLADCHSKANDSQAIVGWNGPGPFKITNNHLEGGQEVVLFGGQTPSVSGLIPSDIEVRGNRITRPVAWRGVWQVKNLWECKSCQRVLIDGNVLENNWVDGQSGFAVLLQGLSDNNDALQSRVWDVTIRNNIIRNTPSGFNLLSRVSYNGGPLPKNPMRRVAIYNNVIALNANLGGAGRGVQLLADLRDVTIAKNTFLDVTGALLNADMSFDDASQIGPMVNLQIVNNVLGPAQYSPIMGDGTVGGLTTLARFAPGGLISGNLLINAIPNQYPGGNYYANSLSNAGLGRYGSGDFTLRPPSDLTGQFSSTPGANWDVISSAVMRAMD